MKKPIRKTFDQAFYERFYSRPGTAVTSDDDIDRLARFVTAYLDHLRVRVRTVLDAGCGTGLWRDALRRIDPGIEYVGVDPSEYLCDRFGWTRGTIADYKSRRRFDLIVCMDVFQYLSGAEARRSTDNIARLCRGALYFDVPTREDIDDGSLDMSRTDGDIHVRDADWYRRLLSRHFTSAGGGVFVPNDSRTVVLALERG